MRTEDEVKEFLKKVVPYNRKNGGNQATLALFLNKYGIAIKGVLLNMEDSKSYIQVEYLDGTEIKEAKFDIEEIEGRSAEEIFKNMETADETDS